ncbi:hypothetical protein GII32_10755 [Gordonia amarae]|uniref:hypothetical protein n=1 Tax=Gordonia amarae TaxID=36821 RepID=UPI001AF4CC12|nr:hypothetical protein [Gordonia amarae]QHN30797.1 hypothetical protein GII32_10755 [Gordonia amarae]
MTTRTIFKRVATAAAIAASTLSGTLGISAVNAGQAAAAVDNGRYMLTTISYGIFPVSQDVTVRNNAIYGQSPTPLRLISTPRGGYADANLVRYTFTRKGQNYYGHAYLGPAPIGDVALIKKR